MASNSPGTYLGSAVFNENQELPVVSGLLADISGTPGKFQLNVAGGFPRDPSLMIRDSGYISTSDGASTCSSSTAEMCDLEGGSLLLLESKSLRSFTTNDEYLFAMKEDLADWFSSLYQNYEITADSFFQVLETGVLLCKHANKVQEVAKQRREMGETLEMRSYFIRSVPEGNIPYREGVKPETFQARDNVSNFISWTRQLGIPEVLSFETDDLVLRKNEKSVILCLLEVARVGAKLGMLAPTLVQMEEEIDAELAGEEPQPRVQIKTCDLRSLDERVRDLINRCTCPVQFPMVKVSDGKYKIGDTRSLIFVRILRNHVMVRVGGGWDTLENYLNKHDPCQCNYRGHRPSGVGVTHKVSQQRRSSHPGNNLFQTPNTPAPQKVVSTVANTSRNRSASPQNASRTSSPNLVISRNIPAPSKSHASPNSASKGVHLTPSENQPDPITGTWPCQPSKSGDLIRSSSPSPSRLKTPSPLTVLQNTHPLDSVSHKTSSSALPSRKDAQVDTTKTIKPRKNSVPSINCENEEYVTASNNGSFAEEDENENLHNRDGGSEARSYSFSGHRQLVSQGSHLPGTFELMTSDKPTKFSSAFELLNQQQHSNSVQKSEMSAEHSQTVGHNLTEASIWNSVKETGLPGQEMRPAKVTMKLNDFKNVSDSQTGVQRAIRRNSLPQLDGGTHGLSSALVANKQKDHKVFKNNYDKTKNPKVSHSKLQSLTQRTALASPHIAHKVSPTARKATEKDNKMADAKLSTDANTDMVLQVASASTESLVTANEADLMDISSNKPKSPSRSKPVVDSSSYIPQMSTNNAAAEDDILVSPLKDTLASTARERPASKSRIPKPSYTSRPTTPQTRITSGSRHDSKDNPDSPKLLSQKDLYQGSIHTVSGNEPLASSKSNNSLSCVKSSDEIPLSPANNICNESVKPVMSVVHNTNISDNLHSINSSSFSVLGNTDVPVSHHRNSPSKKLPQVSPVVVLKPASPNATNPETQEMITNDITFSDDEEVNELIKNLALKKKENTKNVQSTGSWTKKYVLQKSKKKEEVIMISRNSSGLHAVQHEVTSDSTPKSPAVRRPQSSASSKDFLSYEKGSTISSTKNVDIILFDSDRNPSAESNELHEKNAAVSASVLGNISFSRTEAWVDSTLPGNTRLSLPPSMPVQPRGNEFLASDVSSGPCEEIQEMLTDTKNGFIHDDSETVVAPLEDPHVHTEMQKLYDTYKEMQLNLKE